MISVIVPVLNESKGIVSFLEPLQKYRNTSQDSFRTGRIELIVVDGGSADTTIELAAPLCDLVEVSEKGRARQMNLGAKNAKSDILLFLHADTIMPEGFPAIIEAGLANKHKVWGRFNVRLSGRYFSFRMIEFFMNIRSRWTGIATGDQAIFVTADVFQQINGYENIPLMEDVAFSKTLKKISPPVCLNERIITSSRRWEDFGIWRTILLMWKLRISYYFGADPNRLAIKYK